MIQQPLQKERRGGKNKQIKENHDALSNGRGAKGLFELWGGGREKDKVHFHLILFGFITAWVGGRGTWGR